MASQIPMSKRPTEPHVRQDRVRLTFLLYRKPGTSVEEFQRYWRDEHSQIFAHLDIVKRNLLSYEQSHVNEEARTKLQELGFKTLDCDGLATFEAVSWDKLLEVFTDKDYKETAIADEEKFVDRSRTVSFPSNMVGLFDDPT